MSVINNDRDLETLLVDIRTRDLSDKDLSAIADALPSTLLLDAFLRRCQPGLPPVFPENGSMTPEEALDRGIKIGRLARIFLAWIKMPQQRLGQLIKNARTPHATWDLSQGDTSMYFVSDEDLVAQIETFVVEYTTAASKA